MVRKEQWVHREQLGLRERKVLKGLLVRTEQWVRLVK
jgi:hypothetical protein